MKTLLIERKPTTEIACEGFLTFDGVTLCTIERPWIPVGNHKGGQNYRSCVPVGRYKLLQHTRPNGDNVLALENTNLDVYYNREDVPNDEDGLPAGRWLILLHKGNWVMDVVGCIAPGLSKSNHQTTRGPMVVRSSDAMEHIMNFVGTSRAELIIKWIT